MLTKIEDSARFSEARGRLDKIIAGPYLLSDSWIRERHWTVGILEGAAYFSPHEAASLADAAASFTCQGTDAVPTEELNPPAFLAHIQLTRDGLLSLSELYPLSLVLLPELPEFVALLTPDYHLLAGPRSFVESAIGSTAAAAYEHFITMFCKPDVPKGIREVYEGLTRYLPLI
jgi:hypothetical protein